MNKHLKFNYLSYSLQIILKLTQTDTFEDVKYISFHCRS